MMGIKAATLFICCTIPLTLTSCRVSPKGNPDASVLPAVKPTTELEYLLTQNQLPRALRATNQVVRRTTDAKGVTTDVVNEPSLESASPTPATSSPKPSQSNNTTQVEPDPHLLVNPTSCDWAAKEKLFLGTNAQQVWAVNDDLYTEIVTSHAIDFPWVQSHLTACPHIQVHDQSTVFTIDRTYSTATINGATTIVEDSVKASKQADYGVNAPAIMIFSRRLITTLSAQKVSIEVSLTKHEPLTDTEQNNLATLLSRQIGNIPAG